MEQAALTGRGGAAPPSPHGVGLFHGNRDIPLEKWGLTGLREEVLREAARIQQPVARVTHVASLGGRVGPDLGLAASPRTERLAWKRIALWAARTGRPGRRVAGLQVGCDRHGRIRLRCDAEGSLLPLARAPIEAAPIAELDLDRQAVDLLAAAVEGGERLDRLDAEALAEWESLLTEEECRTMLVTLSDATQQSAPLLLFVGEELFGNLIEENLAGKSLLPSARRNVLRPRPLRDFLADRPAVRMLAYSAWLLYRAGGSYRLEERNWSQVTPTHVAEHLAAALRRYGNDAGGRPSATAPTELFSLASAVREGRERFARECQAYRFIWGPTLRKQERFAHHDEVAKAKRAFAEALGASRRHTGGGELRLSTFEEAIAMAVAAVIRATDADVAMSRGHRDPRELAAGLAAEEWAELAGREQDEFFCCVLPSASTAVSGARPNLMLELWAIAARMEYNCWHFFAGNLPEVPEVRSRDRFIPPKVPDIAVWSDQHHRGHVAADVRFSVRAPAPATLADRTLWGFCDIRLMRFSGRPFTEKEMLVGLAGARHVAELTTAASNLDAGDGRFRDSRVTAFDRAWYLRGDALDLAHELLG